MLAFRRFDPAPCDFPPARVPVLPPLQRVSLRARSVPLRADARWYRRGRYALHEALKLAGVGPRAALLAPSYHCRTMIDPAVALGAEVRLYRVQADLAPDLADLAALLARRDVPAKAVLVPHYFGFAQDLQPIAALCRAHGVVLIEDCSHALVGPQSPGHRLGTTGDLVVGSPYKFFPSPDGGLLWRNAAPLPPPEPARRAWREEAGTALRLLRAACTRRLAPDARSAEEAVRAAAARPQRPPREWTALEADPSAHYTAGEEHGSALRASHWIARHTDLDRLAARRRAHYVRWAEAVERLAGCRALFPRLRDDTVPYMFPLLLERPAQRFALLKHLGLPIWRWDEMAVSPCRTAAAYRLALLHLPCHQALSDADLDWMTSALAHVCGMRDADDRSTHVR